MVDIYCRSIVAHADGLRTVEETSNISQRKGGNGMLEGGAC